MGAYRLLLAILVAISHMGVTVFGYNPGVFAVISFLIISGFVMTALIRRNFSSLNQVPAFYVDRALRLYPQFLFYFVISCVLIASLLPDSRYMLALTAENIIPSLAIAPLNFWMFGLTLPDILPPAWSLGLEVLFYLVIPFLVLLNVRGPFFIASVLVFCVACLGYVNTDFWGYRLLPGVLFMFLCGSYLYDHVKRDRIMVGFTCLASLAACIAILCGVIPKAPFNTEVTAGIAFGVPAVYFLSRFGYHKIDEFFGNISYGVFLNHFVVIYAAEAMGYKDATPTYVISVVVVAFICSGISYYLVERPALKWRNLIRARSRAVAAEPHLKLLNPGKSVTCSGG